MSLFVLLQSGAKRVKVSVLLREQNLDKFNDYWKALSSLSRIREYSASVNTGGRTGKMFPNPRSARRLDGYSSTPLFAHVQMRKSRESRAPPHWRLDLPSNRRVLLTPPFQLGTSLASQKTIPRGRERASLIVRSLPCHKHMILC